MKFVYISAIAFASFYQASGQSLERDVVASGGSFSSTSTMSLSYTIGESMITTLSNSSGTLTQGFQQSSTPGGNNLAVEGLLGDNIHIYPNPFAQRFTIQSTQLNQLTLKVVDVLGQEIAFTDEKNGDQLLVDISKESSGIYFLRISEKQTGNIIQTVKLQKY